MVLNTVCALTNVSFYQGEGDQVCGVLQKKCKGSKGKGMKQKGGKKKGMKWKGGKTRNEMGGRQD
jgi:hypothetical protein